MFFTFICLFVCFDFVFFEIVLKDIYLSTFSLLNTREKNCLRSEKTKRNKSKKRKRKRKKRKKKMNAKPSSSFRPRPLPHAIVLLLLLVITLLATTTTGKSFHRGYDTNTINRQMRTTIPGYPCILLLDANRSVGCSRKNKQTNINSKNHNLLHNFLSLLLSPPSLFI